jgi:hypothetical protein
VDSPNRATGSTILRYLIPKHGSGYALILGVLLIHIGHYVWRSQRDEFIMDAGLGLFFILLPVLLILVPLLALFSLGIIRYTIRTRGNLAPVLFLCIGYVVVQLLPLPPSPAETTFYAQRSEYEAAVRIAQQEGLGHSENCGYAYALPKQYEHLTHNCVFLIDKPALAIAFSPLSSHRVIAYAERPEALNELEGCGVDGSVFKQLQPTWYICTPAQD